VVLFAGLSGAAFNQAKELEMGYGDSLTIGNYKLVCQSYTQDSNANYDTDFALLDVYRGDKKISQMSPERRFYTASQTTSTIVAIHSTPLRDLYVVFEGRNPETNKPIIKVFLNPLVSWIWVGVAIVFAGTMLALLPGIRPLISNRAAPAMPARELQAVGGD
jgi:cytochrome c-type biogenesis protein CcmF